MSGSIRTRDQLDLSVSRQLVRGKPIFAFEMSLQETAWRYPASRSVALRSKRNDSGMSFTIHDFWIFVNTIYYQGFHRIFSFKRALIEYSCYIFMKIINCLLFSFWLKSWTDLNFWTSKIRREKLHFTKRPNFCSSTSSNFWSTKTPIEMSVKTSNELSVKTSLKSTLWNAPIGLRSCWRQRGPERMLLRLD